MGRLSGAVQIVGTASSHQGANLFNWLPVHQACHAVLGGLIADTNADEDRIQGLLILRTISGVRIGFKSPFLVSATESCLTA